VIWDSNPDFPDFDPHVCRITPTMWNRLLSKTMEYSPSTMNLLTTSSEYASIILKNYHCIQCVFDMHKTQFYVSKCYYIVHFRLHNIGYCLVPAISWRSIVLGHLCFFVGLTMGVSEWYYYYYYYYYYKCHGLECCHHTAAGALYKNLDLKLLHSSMQTSVDHRSRRRHVSRMTDEKGETWSPSGMSTVTGNNQKWVAS